MCFTQYFTWVYICNVMSQTSMTVVEVVWWVEIQSFAHHISARHIPTLEVIASSVLKIMFIFIVYAHTYAYIHMHVHGWYLTCNCTTTRLCIVSSVTCNQLSGSFSLTLWDLTWLPKVALLVVLCSLPMPLRKLHLLIPFLLSVVSFTFMHSFVVYLSMCQDNCMVVETFGIIIRVLASEVHW